MTAPSQGSHLPVLILTVLLHAPSALGHGAAGEGGGAVAAGTSLEPVWAIDYNGPSNHVDEARCIALDSQQNVIVLGTSYSPAVNTELTVVKYSPDGKLQWARQIGWPSHDVVGDLVIDSQDRINIAAQTWDSGFRVSVIQYDAAGNLQWDSHYPLSAGLHDLLAPKLAVDSQDNLYATGATNGDYLLLKYDQRGKLLWEKQFDASRGEDDVATDVALDSQGNVYVAGVIGPGFDSYITVKYDASGQYLWDRHEPGIIGTVFSPAWIDIDAQDNAVVAGVPETTCGLHQFRVWKYAPNGDLQWMRFFPENPCKATDAIGMKLDPAGNVIMTGYTLVSSSVQGVIVKWSAAGDQLWDRLFPHDDGSSSHPYALAVDGWGNIHVTADASLGGNHDYRTVKYDPMGNVVWDDYHDGPSHGADRPFAITTDNTGGVFVTGRVSVQGAVGNFGTVRYQQPPCTDDITLNAVVSIEDLLFVIGHWGLCPSQPAECFADIVPDGDVNVNDLLVVINGWGACR